jgi:hypothetical protein
MLELTVSVVSQTPPKSPAELLAIAGGIPDTIPIICGKPEGVVACLSTRCDGFSVKPDYERHVKVDGTRTLSPAEYKNHFRVSGKHADSVTGTCFERACGRGSTKKYVASICVLDADGKRGCHLQKWFCEVAGNVCDGVKLMNYFTENCSVGELQ